MLNNSKTRARRAFTLVEVMVVIAVIILLMGITSQMVGSVGDAQGRARARTDMNLIATGLEAFAGQYGGFPRINCSTNEKTGAGDLYKCLVGKMALAIRGNEIYMEDISGVPRKPFIDASLIPIADPDNADAADVDSEKAGVYFIDPWRQPYMYFYDTSRIVGVVDGVWRSPSFLLLSKGPDEKIVEIGNMHSKGIVPDEEEYTSKDENIDNIIQGRGK